MKVIKFGKPDCAPCQAVEKFLKASGVDYLSVNPFETEEFDLLIKHNVKTVPITVLVDEKGEELQRKAGFNEAALTHLIETYKSNV